MKLLLVIASIALVLVPLISAYAHYPEYSRYSSRRSVDHDSPPADKSSDNTTGDITSVLRQNGLTTVLDLMSKASLSRTLAGPELTIWAPTNEAFAALDSKTINDAELLKDILNYHIVSFKNDPKEISSIQTDLTVPTLQGEVVRINIYRKKGVSFAFKETVTVNGALVLKTIRASNGIVYIIDTVLNPKDLEPKNTQMQVLRSNKEFSIIYKMFEDLGITQISDKYRPKTFFAPTNAAFEKLPPGVLDSLFASQEEIGKLINTHTASGTYYSHGLVSGPIPVFSGSNLDLDVSPSGVTIENAKIIGFDLTETEGVIHVIDAVIPNKEEASLCPAVKQH
ncbi:transforming growth factor-beta-induced protein ig-h3-like [Daphnia carinata]|uniref:transforming growth factor-beta-induced protein ig-h3-like n=1 Tax=Daphnia carinata TaxID=120202 RepID=UPI00257EC333|nr:transforming growth factor-beta-induced protein ig-h3-like [Daphnia carinata]